MKSLNNAAYHRLEYSGFFADLGLCIHHTFNWLLSEGMRAVAANRILLNKFVTVVNQNPLHNTNSID